MRKALERISLVIGFVLMFLAIMTCALELVVPTIVLAGLLLIDVIILM